MERKRTREQCSNCHILRGKHIGQPTKAKNCYHTVKAKPKALVFCWFIPVFVYLSLRVILFVFFFFSYVNYLLIYSSFITCLTIFFICLSVSFFLITNILTYAFFKFFFII